MAEDTGKNLEDAVQSLESKNKKMMIVVILLALIAIGGTGGATAYFMFFNTHAASASGGEGGENGAAAEGEASHEAEETSSHEEPSVHTENAMLGPSFTLDNFLVNLDEEDGSRYLKTSLVIEVDTAETVEEMTKRLPQIQDVTITLISSKAYIDLQGADGKFRLREELRYRYNKLLGGKVSRIYFTSFIIQ